VEFDRDPDPTANAQISTPDVLSALTGSSEAAYAANEALSRTTTAFSKWPAEIIDSVRVATHHAAGEAGRQATSNADCTSTCEANVSVRVSYDAARQSNIEGAQLSPK
jgi:hypothetical protein